MVEYILISPYLCLTNYLHTIHRLIHVQVMVDVEHSPAYVIVLLLQIVPFFNFLLLDLFVLLDFTPKLIHAMFYYLVCCIVHV